MSWQPGDAIWSHAYGIRLDGELPQPQKLSRAPEPGPEYPPIVLLECNGLITGWVPVESWRGERWLKEQAEALAIERQMRIEGLRKSLSVAALGFAVFLGLSMWLISRI